MTTKEKKQMIREYLKLYKACLKTRTKGTISYLSCATRIQELKDLLKVIK